jgi:molecular chaperone DnaK
VDEIKAKTDALESAFHKVSEQIYANAQQSAAADGGGGGESAAGSDDEEVVDAEVVEDEAEAGSR